MSKKFKPYYTLKELEEYIDSIPWWQNAWWAFLRLPSDLYWGFMHRFHPKYIHHIVHTGLKPGYYDPDSQIVNTIFTLTKRFIEKAEIAWDSDPNHAEVYRKLKEAIDWWDANPDHHHFCDILTPEKGEELQKHLNNIVSVLPYLWYP